MLSAQAPSMSPVTPPISFFEALSQNIVFKIIAKVVNEVTTMMPWTVSEQRRQAMMVKIVAVVTAVKLVLPTTTIAVPDVLGYCPVQARKVMLNLEEAIEADRIVNVTCIILLVER